MASPELSVRLARTWRLLARPSVCSRCHHSRRGMATAVNALDNIDLEASSFEIPAPKAGEIEFDPLASSRGRKRQLPRSRYQFRPPKYDRGPLHPHQAPKASDPSSRLFIPGPFSSPRMEQTYHNTIAPDFMTMCYQHTPPGFRPLEKAPRLRSWEGNNPYFANRQLRGPRGGDVLRLLRRPITFRNIPMIEQIVVHSYVQGAVHSGSSFIHVAGMVLQAITNVRIETHKSKHGEAGWGLVRGKTVAATATLKGENMYHFLGKLVNVVMPRIKDWKGVKATAGDSSGNLSFGFEPEVVGGFPEIEVNYDSYPPKMIPGVHIHIQTTAPMDKDARLLLQQFGIPFHGKVVD